MTGPDRFRDLVGRDAARRMRAQTQREGTWYWLGMLGLIGWSVALPTVAGIALGRWLDVRAAASFSWTITLMVVGLAVGVTNAWFWVRWEADEEREQDHPHQPDAPDQTGAPDQTEDDKGVGQE